MDRTEEVEAINNFLSEHPEQVKHCSMGEMHYGEEGPTYRERIANSFKTGHRKPRIDKTCEHCGAQMRLAPFEADRKYCSRECSAVGAGKKRSKMVETPCDGCGKIYKRRLSEMHRNHKYCGRDCSNKANAGRNGAGKKTTWNGVEYSSLSAAARAAGMTRVQLQKAMK